MFGVRRGLRYIRAQSVKETRRWQVFQWTSSFRMFLLYMYVCIYKHCLKSPLVESALTRSTDSHNCPTHNRTSS